VEACFSVGMTGSGTVQRVKEHLYYVKSGWLVTMVIIWPIVFELIWLFGQTFRTQESQLNPRAA
jgi:hypothetical protein